MRAKPVILTDDRLGFKQFLSILLNLFEQWILDSCNCAKSLQSLSLRMKFFANLPLIIFDSLLSHFGLVVNCNLSRLLRHLTLCPVVACGAHLEAPCPRLLLQLQGI
jgi:hypothetical protein